MSLIQKKPGELSVKLTKGWELVIDKVSIGLFCVWVGSVSDDRYIGFHFGQAKYKGEWQWGYLNWFYDRDNHSFGLGPLGLIIWSFE